MKFINTARKHLTLTLLAAAPLWARAGSLTIYTWGGGDEIWCEDQYVAMNTLKNEPSQLGDGPVTLRLDEDMALGETLDFSWIDRDITLDLNGNALTPDARSEWFGDELLNIELQNGRSFTLKDGSVSGAKRKGAIRIAAGQRVHVANVTFENNRCDGNLGDLWEGDVGGAIRCNSNLKLTGCTFRNNSCTTHGGAVGLYSNDYQSRFVIENCTFEENTAGEAGGALFLGCSGRIQNTVVRNNTVTGREDGDTQGQNETAAGQGGGVYLTRHGGVSFGAETEGFWWGRFEGPTLMIEEGVEITGNTASPKAGASAVTNNLYLARSWNSYLNAAVMVSGDTWSETSVGLTLSTGSGIFSRTLNEEGGGWIVDDYSAWFFSDNGLLVPCPDDEDCVLRLIRPTPLGALAECQADSAEEAVRQCSFKPADDVSDNLNAADRASYEAMFAPVATSLGENAWSVSFELSEAATNVLRMSATAAQTAVLAAMLNPAAKTATFAATPGFFYAIEYGPSPDLGSNTQGAMATGDFVELGKPANPSPTGGFFRVAVSPVQIAPRP